MEKKRVFSFEKAAAVTISVFGVAVLIYLFFKYLLPVLLPFLIAWCAALAVRPAARWLNRQIHLPVRVLSLILLILLLAGIFGLLFLLCSRLIIEAQQLFERLVAHPEIFDELLLRVNQFFDGIFANFSESAKDSAVSLQVEQYLMDFLERSAEKALVFLANAVGKIVMALPSALFLVVITLIAAVYFALDLHKVHAAVRAVLPEKMQSGVLRLKELLRTTVFLYLRAYSILALLTFLILLVGFLILGIRYAVLIAFIFTLVDILPVLGVGTMLVPWGLFRLMVGDLGGGMGLLILFAVCVVVRQFAEPKIIGSHMGIHPLPALFAMYAGFCFFGFFGMIAGPFLAVVLRGVISLFTHDEEKGRAEKE